MVALCLCAACAKNRTGRGPEIGGADKGCYVYTTKDDEFTYISQQATVETRWHDEWTSRHGRTLPDSLPDPDVWQYRRNHAVRL